MIKTSIILRQLVNMKKIIKTYLIASLLLIPLFIHAQVTSVENDMQTYSIKQTDAQIAFLKKIVDMNSGTTNPRGVRRVGNVVQTELKKLGFKTYWVEEPSSFHRAGTLVAEHKGKSGKRLLLIGHLDTVFPASSSRSEERRVG